MNPYLKNVSTLARELDDSFIHTKPDSVYCCNAPLRSTSVHVGKNKGRQQFKLVVQGLTTNLSTDFVDKRIEPINRGSQFSV